MLPNDSDPDGDVITVISAVASVGQATLVGNQINYAPPANFNGTATITYMISDGEGEMIEDLVLAAHNDAKAKLDQAMAEKTQAMTEGMQLPPGMKLPF